MRKRSLWCFASAFAATCLSGAAGAEPGPGWIEAPVETRHSLPTPEGPLDYVAETGRVAIRDVATGAAQAMLFYVAYRLPTTKAGKRPIAFVWNGGPGSPALPLHFGTAGPMRGEGTGLVDNPDSWLTEADLVFVDPVDTGFSRAIDTAFLPAFTSIVGDVAAMTEFVRCWLLLHDAEQRPIVIVGESYGAGRAASVGYRLLDRGADVRGLVLISGAHDFATDAAGKLAQTALHVGDYAVAALYHHRLPRAFGTDPASARTQAESWARRVYQPALRQRAALDPLTRERIARDLAAHAGTDPASIDRATLVIRPVDHLAGLHPGRVPSYSDIRRTGPDDYPWSAAALRHLRRNLGWRSDLPYLGTGGEATTIGFAPDGTPPSPLHQRWTQATVRDATPAQLAAARKAFAASGELGHGRVGPPLPGTIAAFARAPRLRVLVAHGAYDPLGGCSIDAEVARRLPAAMQRGTTMRCYDGGHMMYRDAGARALFNADVKALLRAVTR